MTLTPALTTERSHVLLGSVDMWPTAATAQELGHWATPHVNDNPAFRWIVAKYVEGGNPNRNNHMWSPEDLASSVESIRHTPMNMLHKSHHVVGSFTAAKYMDRPHTATLAQEGDFNPYVEVVGPFWRYYFPNELYTVESAFEEGRLFVSMECVSETARWHRASDGATEDFPYMGPTHQSYGEWQAEGNVLQFVNPHFLGGGLIVPPVAPGWGGAEVREMAHYVEKNQEEAEDIYASVARLAPHLSPKEWENVMLFILEQHKNP